MNPITSMEGEGPREEEPQPPEPPPLYKELESRFGGSLAVKSSDKASTLHLEWQTYRHPHDLLEELEFEDAALLTSLFMRKDAETVFGYDTYSDLSLQISPLAWSLKLQNIDGYSRSISYDYRRPGRVEMREEDHGSDGDLRTPHRRITRRLDSSTIARLEEELQYVVHRFDEMSSPFMNTGRPKREPIEAADAHPPVHTSILRRLGGVVFRRSRIQEA